MSHADEPRSADSACVDLAARCLSEVEGFRAESAAFGATHTATLAQYIHDTIEAYCRQVDGEIRAWRGLSERM